MPCGLATLLLLEPADRTGWCEPPQCIHQLDTFWLQSDAKWCYGDAMPTISLRLTDEELAALRSWAADGRRSVQKEIIFRLFTEPTATARHELVADAQSRDTEARTVKPTVDQAWLMRRSRR